ncbi:HdeD family acid-resistance protein [Stenotrophomonas indicatrix]|uniref:HdeD family acid-resistance protein n=1 Tax=Stenotrophomonas indicatrix TaxID=2045451 RepID=UPI0003EA754B|nr:membrane protein [Stenotrophomonas maltophilia 5BA-I-2]
MNSPLSPLLSAVGRSWWILLLYGLVALGFGIIAIGWPMSAAIALAWTLGVMAIVEGVISLLALITGGSGASRGWLLLYVVASLGFGILAVINPLATASVLVLFLAAWLLVAGIYRIVFAIRVRRQIEGEWLLILSGVLAIVLGLLFAANPYAGVAVTTLWIGIGSLLYGVLQVLVAFKLRKLR